MTFTSQEKIEPLFHQHIHTSVKNAPFLGSPEQERREGKETSTNIQTGNLLMYRFPT
jgi:hypothetical protein